MQAQFHYCNQQQGGTYQCGEHHQCVDQNANQLLGADVLPHGHTPQAERTDGDASQRCRGFLAHIE